jgi:hypothetical protein
MKGDNMPDESFDFEATQEAAQTVAEASPEGAGLLAAVMGANADHLTRLQSSLYEGEKAARERAEAEARELRLQLAAVHNRLERLIFDLPGDNPLDYPKEA